MTKEFGNLMAGAKNIGGSKATKKCKTFLAKFKQYDGCTLNHQGKDITFKADELCEAKKGKASGAKPGGGVKTKVFNGG